MNFLKRLAIVLAFAFAVSLLLVPLVARGDQGEIQGAFAQYFGALVQVVGTPGNNNVLTFNSTTGLWGAAAPSGAGSSGVWVTHSATQSNSGSSEKLLAFDTETQKDVAGQHSTSSNNSRLIAQKTGWKALSYSLDFTSAHSSTYFVSCYFKKNGSQVHYGQQITSAQSAASEGSLVTGAFTAYAAANDYFEVAFLVTDGSGGSSITLTASTSSTASMVELP